jgi:hypothetical protein
MELVWKEIRQLQRKVDILNEYRKAQTRINAELIKKIKKEEDNEANYWGTE